MLRPLLLSLAVLLWGGGALADGPWTAWDNYTAAIRGAVQGSTLDEVIQWSDAQFARRAAVGRYVRWGGTILIGSALIYVALDYFYNYLRRETGTPLDTWYRFALPVAVGSCRKSGSVTDWDFTILRPDGQHYPNSGYATSDYVSCDLSKLESFTRHWLGNKKSVVPEPYRSAPWVPTSVNTYCRYSLCYRLAPDLQRPSLSEWIRQNPDAANGVRQAVDRYLQDHPIGSPSAPYPGVELLPVPNPNQWTDNPFTRPDIDTDGDGWPDSIEWYEANRRGVPWPDVINNPQVYPDPNADPDEDGYTNHEELIAGTNPYDPASRPSPRPDPGTRTDTDGDGWPDDEEIRRGTDPRDPNSKPEGEVPPREEEEEEEEDAWPGGPPRVRPEPVELPQTELAKPEGLPKLESEPWERFIESTRERLETRFKQLRDTALTKVPFAFANLVSWRTSLGSSPCAFPFAIGPYQAQVDICGTPVWQAATAFRPILAGLLFVGFGFALVRRSLDVQK
ncbi:hypothetical protein TO73_1604 [Thermus aquaticus Y51MC23]|uniref:Uncharacterized protein n=1 Tax=Thermus aquaticus (strain ATCC BAA-2747 / Y51MC23) TaxID=498848 RepID=A0ABM5VN75_THEA5|nr:hypothetical protein TO73_1604 [Thermus aquaticus Y51MC23]